MKREDLRAAFRKKGTITQPVQQSGMFWKGKQPTEDRQQDTERMRQGAEENGSGILRKLWRETQNKWQKPWTTTSTGWDEGNPIHRDVVAPTAHAQTGNQRNTEMILKSSGTKMNRNQSDGERKDLVLVQNVRADGWSAVVVGSWPGLARRLLGPSHWPL